MMLARVADSLYWLGRYIERAEHLSRLSSAMLNATLDQTDGAQSVWIAMAAVGEPGMPSVSMGRSALVPAACAAVSGATTPSISPLPKLSPFFENRLARP